MKNVLMPQYLFTALYKCMVVDFPGKCEHCIGCEKIKKWLEEKGEKIYVNEQYKKAKLSTDPAEREQAFLNYMKSKSYDTGDIKNGEQ